MDPLSASASILTILGAAGGSVKFLHQFILDFKDTPTELRSYSSHLECLHCTITCLMQVYDNLPPTFRLDARIAGWAAEFMEETTAVRSILEKKVVSMSEGRGQRVRESLRWMLFDRKVRKFFASLEHWNMIFSHAAAASQM